MVTKWGLSEKLGPLKYDEGGEEVFLGRSATQPNHGVSGETARQIDEEVRSIIDECYATAERILEENEDKLHLMAEALIKYETIDTHQIEAIMEGRMPDPPSEWDDGAGGSAVGDEDAGAGDSRAEDKGRDRPIGGPAQEH